MTRLHIVTGKGGTGKTTVAAALAVALAAGRRRVLVCEVEQRQGLAQVFDTAPLPYSEHRLTVLPGGGEVYGLAVDAEAALMEYLALYYHLGRAGRLLKQLGAVDFATTIAPGLRDVLLTGKVYEAARRPGPPGSGLSYDAVVLDAPPTGRIARFLNVNAEVAGLARVGPIHRQAEAIMTLIRSDAATVHLVTLLEEMPVQETLQAVAELAELELPRGTVIVNMVSPDRLAGFDGAVAAATGPDELAPLLAAALGSSLDPVVTGRGLLAEATEHRGRRALERANLDRLRCAGLPMLELPLLPGGVDPGALLELAEPLTGLAGRTAGSFAHGGAAG